MLGVSILVALYFDINRLMYALIIMLLLEGVTNYRIPLLVNRLAGAGQIPLPGNETRQEYRISIESERAWRLVVGSMLLLTYIFYYQSMWFIPWFMGFAILGAGVSAVCPILLIIKRLGLK
jgi:hypothetical protein